MNIFKRLVNKRTKLTERVSEIESKVKFARVFMVRESDDCCILYDTEIPKIGDPHPLYDLTVVSKKAEPQGYKAPTFKVICEYGKIFGNEVINLVTGETDKLSEKDIRIISGDCKC